MRSTGVDRIGSDDVERLPALLTSFVGREREAAEAEALLSRSRLVTLTGPGGAGKTRLALEVARRQHTGSPTSVVFVPLAPVADPALLVPAIAQALGIHEIRQRALLQTLEYACADRELLLVLDNFEHLIAAAPVVASLLSSCAHLKILVTSRIVLRITGEQALDVPPLSLPADDQLLPLDKLSQFDAVRLFVERATSARSDFRLTEETSPAVAAICRRLDGLPLGIELAAAQVRVLPPLALLARLESRLPQLVIVPVDQEERHWTLRNAVAWSYDLLDERQQRLFRFLAVFPGGCTLEAALAVTADPGESETDILQLVASLVDASLLRPVDIRGEPRLTMLATIREFGLEQLESSAEAQAIRRRHCEWCLRVAEPDPTLAWQPQRLDILEKESANLRGAVRWCIQTGEAQLGLRVAGALYPLWLVRGPQTEGRAWLTELLALPAASEPSPARASALGWAGYLAYHQGDLDAASRLGQAAVTIAREANYSQALARPTLLLANIARARGEFESAHALYEKALEATQHEHLSAGAAFVLVERSLTFLDQQDVHHAALDADAALRVLRKLDHPLGAGLALQTLGRVAGSRHELAEAIALFHQALAAQREVGDVQGMMFTLYYLGLAELDRVQPDQARSFLLEAVTLARKSGDQAGVAICLQGLGATLAAAEPVTAVRFAAAAQLVLDSLEVPQSATERPRLDHWLSEARRRLGAQAFTAAWSDGQRTPLEEVLTEARTHTARPAEVVSEQADQQRAHADTLTPREREVVRLLARGLSASEIAQTLVISAGTLRSHIEHVLSKLQLHSRVHLAAWAVQHGYLDLE